jgi:hypothetical protein
MQVKEDIDDDEEVKDASTGASSQLLASEISATSRDALLRIITAQKQTINWVDLKRDPG